MFILKIPCRHLRSLKFLLYIRLLVRFKHGSQPLLRAHIYTSALPTILAPVWVWLSQTWSISFSRHLSFWALYQPMYLSVSETTYHLPLGSAPSFGSRLFLSWRSYFLHHLHLFSSSVVPVTLCVLSDTRPVWISLSSGFWHRCHWSILYWVVYHDHGLSSIISLLRVTFTFMEHSHTVHKNTSSVVATNKIFA